MAKQPPEWLSPEELERWKRNNLPAPGIAVGDAVRVGSWAGPCLDRVVLSIGRSRYKLGYLSKQITSEPVFAYFFEVHIEPCRRCMDHPQTEYPRGYEG